VTHTKRETDNKSYKAGGMAQVVECLPSKHADHEYKSPVLPKNKKGELLTK
jgi:hypothetical protein